MYWVQRAKQWWLKEGDRNTKFFHKVASLWVKRNRIVCLHDQNGELVSDSNEIEEMFLSHFKDIFSCDDRRGSQKWVIEFEGKANCYPDCFQPLLVLGVRITDQQRWELDVSFVEEEVRVAVFQMGRSKAPGPDGFVAGFLSKELRLGGQRGFRFGAILFTIRNHVKGAIESHLYHSHPKSG